MTSQKALLVEQLRTGAPHISVGLLTANWMCLGSELSELERACVGMVHFDVMDGCFCPMMTMGAPAIAGLTTSLLKDVHLMIDEPISKVEAFVSAGADIITVHAESSRHVHRVLQVLGQATNANDSSRGIVRGLALNPGTPLESVTPLLDDLELLVLLAVNPGWSRQKFISGTTERLGQLRRLVGKEFLICVDGGITHENIAEVARSGADIIVTGSAVFDGRSPFDNARRMMDAIQ